MSRFPAPKIGERTGFPSLRSRAYLNHAAVSPLSVWVQEAVERCVKDFAAEGVGAMLPWVAQRNRLRSQISGFIGGCGALSGQTETQDPTDASVALLSCTTQAVAAVAWSINWQSGDRIVLFRGEFPANVTPWMQVADHFDLEIVWLTLDGFNPGITGDDGMDQLERVLQDGARLVAVSAVQFRTGLAMPLAEMGALCRRYGAEFAVDAIQACGAIPIDAKMMAIDYLACGSHKWLMSTEGCAFLYVDPSRVDALKLRLVGWLSHENALDFLFHGPGHLRQGRPIRQRADALEMGARNSIGFSALEAAIRCLDDVGVDNVWTHANRYIDALEAPLVEMGWRSLRAKSPERRSCILSLEPPEDLEAVVVCRALDAAGVSCSAPDGLLRFSPSWPNDLDEVPIVIEAMHRATRGL